MSRADRAPAGLPRGVYLLTDTVLCAERGLAASVRDAIAGGVTAVQYRDKGADPARRRREADELAALCRDAGVTFIINDDPRLAADCGADGVHLGRDDPSPRDVRRRYGRQLLLGVSCYDDPGRARAAIEGGADYVAFGSAYPSATKPDAVHAPLALYRDATARLDVPVVAIGGIDAATGRPLVDAGCHALAVITAILAAPDVRSAAADLAALFREARRGAP